VTPDPVGNSAHAKDMGPIMNNNTSTLTHNDLRQFTGSEHWYRHGISRLSLYTDGVKYLAETASAYWFLDEIAIAQRCEALAFSEYPNSQNAQRNQRLLALKSNEPFYVGA
jgi:hypothetical protein